VEVSYLADTVVSLRYFEAEGEVKQAVVMVKKRTGHHEKIIREFKLEHGRGIRIGPPLRDFRGILSGVPVFSGAKEQIMRNTDGGG
jgi:circadian clock protein KaiC